MESSSVNMKAPSSAPDSLESTPAAAPHAASTSSLQPPSVPPVPCARVGLWNDIVNNSSALLDDFLSWDPWGDDSVRYPGGFWNQARNFPIDTQRPSSIIQSGVASMEAPASDEEEVTSDEEEDEVNGDEETDQSTSDESDEEDGTVSNDTREEKRQEVTIQKEKECTICLEDVATDHYPDLPHAGDSKHGSDVCLRCWDQHLESEITSKGFEGVSCPQCSQRLLETEVRKLATKGTYDQYEIRSS